MFLLGYIENEQDEKFEAPQVINKKKAHALIAELDTTEKVDKGFAELCEYWDLTLERVAYSILRLEYQGVG